MADEIIKLIEYITGNPIVQSSFIGYIVFSAMVAVVAVAVFVFVLRQIFNHRKRRK